MVLGSLGAAQVGQACAGNPSGEAGPGCWMQAVSKGCNKAMISLGVLQGSAAAPGKSLIKDP